mmetsp:Transcript_82910/g.239597  ORF Transcript_82910/g.239597 Transcript_82910/m.239597 type:complete len:293 (+) Transcript_82910:1240-2118(+)
MRREAVGAVMLEGAAGGGVGEDFLRETLRDLGDGALPGELLPAREDAANAEDRATRLVPNACVCKEEEEAHGPQQKPHQDVRRPRGAEPELPDLVDGLAARRDEVQRCHLFGQSAENDERHKGLHREERQPKEVAQSAAAKRDGRQPPQVVRGPRTRHQMQPQTHNGDSSMQAQKHVAIFAGAVRAAEQGIGRQRRGPYDRQHDVPERAAATATEAASAEVRAGLPPREEPEQAVQRNEEPDRGQPDGEGAALQDHRAVVDCGGRRDHEAQADRKQHRVQQPDSVRRGEDAP